MIDLEALTTEAKVRVAVTISWSALTHQVQLHDQFRRLEVAQDLRMAAIEADFKRGTL
jgi:hypothetical protein